MTPLSEAISGSPFGEYIGPPPASKDFSGPAGERLLDVAALGLCQTIINDTCGFVEGKKRPHSHVPLFLWCEPQLEAEAKLKFDDAAREAIRGPAELSGIDDVGWRGRRRQGFEIQYVEGIKEIAAELELGIFA